MILVTPSVVIEELRLYVKDPQFTEDLIDQAVNDKVIIEEPIV